MIGDRAFNRCPALISLNLPKNVENVHDKAFLECHTLGSRQSMTTFAQYEKDESNFEVLKSKENVKWLRNRYDQLPLHRICIDPNITMSQLEEAIRNCSETTQQKDKLGLTALHTLCLNRNSTLSMYKFLIEAFPELLNMKITVAKNLNRQHEMITPVKLWLKMKSIQYNDDHFNSNGKMNLRTALKIGLQWNDMPSLIYLQASYPDFKERDEKTNFYIFIEAALKDNDSCLETVYELIRHYPSLIFDSFK